MILNISISKINLYFFTSDSKTIPIGNSNIDTITYYLGKSIMLVSHLLLLIYLTKPFSFYSCFKISAVIIITWLKFRKYVKGLFIRISLLKTFFDKYCSLDFYLSYLRHWLLNYFFALTIPVFIDTTTFPQVFSQIICGTY